MSRALHWYRLERYDDKALMFGSVSNIEAITSKIDKLIYSKPWRSCLLVYCHGPVYYRNGKIL